METPSIGIFRCGLSISNRYDMSFFKDFKEFAIKGNMVDMAIGIIVGAAFKDVIDVIVKKVIMPPLSLMTDAVNVANKKWVLQEGITGADGEKTEEVAIAYGELFEVFLDFLIIAMVIFLVVRFMNNLKKKAEDPKDKTVKTPADIQLLTDIKELMEVQNENLKAKK